MWLLNARTLALEYVNGPRGVHYAILSHTWEEEEVTFQEIKEGSGQHKEGYQKIVKTCRQAVKDGLEHVWVDTCCINKESSAELTESINSMWRWYCDAEVCYAYLGDVFKEFDELSDANHPDFADDDAVTDAVGHVAFARSRWFSRGWTLQELIAPKNLIFFDEAWGRIGKKSTMLRTLSQITGIDAPVLKDRRHLLDYVIARKMSWAAERTTTRLEDRAYSLFGIFGVNMPLLYGEGEKAFIRFQEEIIRTSTDHSIFAWSPLDSSLSHNILGLEKDLIFAQSPRQFANCRKMTRWTTNLFDEDYRLTNRGVTFESLLFFETKEDYFAVLNCRYEDDFSGAIAFKLCNRDQHTVMHESEIKKLRGRNDFWIKEPSRERFLVYSAHREARKLSRKVILLRYHPTVGQFDGNKITASRAFDLPKFWLVNSSSSLEGFIIVDSYPKGVWNHSTAVMCPSNSLETHWSCASGGPVSIMVENTRSKTRFCLAFMAEELASEGQSLVISARSQEDTRSLVATHPGREAYIDREAPVSGVLATSSPPTEMYGDAVCVITITIGDESGKSSNTTSDRMEI